MRSIPLSATGPRYASRPEARMREDGQPGGVPNFVDTGNILGDTAQLYGAEAAWVYGPLSIQAEYATSNVHRAGGASEVWFNGGYVFVSYFLTSENRNYNRKSGIFDRVKVFEPFFCVCTEDNGICKGSGAWELKARWSYLDLDDENISGGFLDDFTIGFNWWLNGNFIIQFDYIYADLDRPAIGLVDDNTSIFITRFNINF